MDEPVRLPVVLWIGDTAQEIGWIEVGEAKELGPTIANVLRAAADEFDKYGEK